MKQFGGHHLVINATVVGSNITLSPCLTGGQPLKFNFEGQHVYIVEKEALQADAILKSLTDAQRAKAVVSTALGDIVLRLGQDGKVLKPEGLAGAEMIDAQKAQFLSLIATRLSMPSADDLAPKMAVIEADLDRTTFWAVRANRACRGCVFPHHRTDGYS